MPHKPPRVSVFTPFLRRFTDERARDLADTEALFWQVGALHRDSPFADEDAVANVCGPLFYQHGYNEVPADNAFWVAIYVLLAMETAIFDWPEDTKITDLSIKEQVDLRRFLRSKQHFLANQERVCKLLVEGINDIFRPIASALPKTESPSPFTIPLLYSLPAPREIFGDIYNVLWRQPYVDNGVFVEVSRQLYLNLCAASGIADPHEPKKPFKMPQESDAPLDQVVKTYFHDTLFADFLMTPLPLQLTTEQRFSHMHVVGGSGAGKTQLLQSLILHDLQSEDPPALVVVDSQGDLINKVSHLRLFLRDERLILITPKDIEHPPALNIFDINRRRLDSYDDYVKEQVVAGVIQTFDYLFAGLLGADLTAKQGVFFRYIARLLLALPETLGRNATILDMIAIMDDLEPYRPAVESLPDIQRQFFERDFVAPKGKKGTFDQTREQIRYRLQAILENPTLARLFTSPRTKIDLFTELNRGSVILVDTAKDFLKSASGNFGRIFISLVLQAILERAVIPEEERKPAFLIVDEAAAYFDSNIDDLLTEARKYKLGCVFAHQFLDQATSSLRASLAANTAAKMVGGVSMGDARALAPDLRTTADFIISQPRLHFACHIRHVTPQAVSIPVQAGQLEEQPKLFEDEYEELRERNRARVGLLPQPKTVPAAAAAGPPPKVDTARPDRPSGPTSAPKGPTPAPQAPDQSGQDDDTAPAKEWT